MILGHAPARFPAYGLARFLLGSSATALRPTPICLARAITVGPTGPQAIDEPLNPQCSVDTASEVPACRNRHFLRRRNCLTPHVIFGEIFADRARLVLTPWTYSFTSQARRPECASAHADELIGLLPLLRRQRLVERLQGRLDFLHRGEMLFHRLQMHIDPLRQSPFLAGRRHPLLLRLRDALRLRADGVGEGVPRAALRLGDTQKRLEERQFALCKRL